MTTHKAHTKPVQTLKDGPIKASIWKNKSTKKNGEQGTFYSVKIVRVYQDVEGNYHDSDSFSGVELLQVSRLAERSYDAIAKLRQKDRDAADEAATAVAAE